MGATRQQLPLPPVFPLSLGPADEGKSGSIPAQQVATAAELNHCIEQAKPSQAAGSIRPILQQLPLVARAQ